MTATTKQDYLDLLVSELDFDVKEELEDGSYILQHAENEELFVVVNDADWGVYQIETPDSPDFDAEAYASGSDWNAMVCAARSLVERTVCSDQSVQDLLYDLLEENMDHEDTRVDSVRTYEDACMLTRDKGLVIKMSDGSEYQITIVQSRRSN